MPSAFLEKAFLEECLCVLTRTPATFNALLRGLPDSWTSATEGPGTWSPHMVMGHLIHADKVDWMPRLEIILQHGTTRPFDPFDRMAELDPNQPLPDLLDQFSTLRQQNLTRLQALNLQPEQLALEGLHPALGPVTVRQLLATWTAHDLAHLLQVSRVMAKHLKLEVGPWAEYLSVMNG